MIDAESDWSQLLEQRRRVRVRIFVAQIALMVGITALVGVGLVWPDLLGVLVFGLLFGALGGSVGLLRRLASKDGRAIAELSGDPISTLMPLLYGSVMAGVVYLLFMAGILSGDKEGMLTSDLFPVFKASTAGSTLSVEDFVAMRHASLQDAGKLLVWSFVAGYSEHFVTGVLEQLERRVPAQQEAKAGERPDRPAPARRAG